MKRVRIFLRQTSPIFDKIYTYHVPEHLEDAVAIGRRVLLPFGRQNKMREAFIFSLDAPESNQDLKEIIAFLDEGPILSQVQIRLIAQMKQRYACTYDQAAQLMLPSGLRLNIAEDVRLVDESAAPVDLLAHFQGHENLEIPLQDLLIAGFTRTELNHLVDMGTIQIATNFQQETKRKTVEFCKLTDRALASLLLEEQSLGSIQQEEAVRFLLEENEAQVQDLLQYCNINRSSLRTLQKKNLITFFRRPWAEVEAYEASEEDTDLLPSDLTEVTDDMLSSGQVQALDAIFSSLNQADKSKLEFLLLGVTGSGKTEIYMRAARACLAQGKSVILLVPEISLTPQMTAHFEQNFPNEVIVLHSRLTPRERFNRWERVFLGQVPIVVGARSAIFSPLENLGLIIIDEEQEESYQSEMNPRYHATTIARLRQRNENCVLLLGSATPSLESYIRTMEGRSQLLRLEERPGTTRMPKTHFIDLRRTWNSDTEGLLSQELLNAMASALNRNEHVLLFLNRRGYAANYLCRSCGKSMECPNCSVGMTYHKQRNRLVCHYCGYIGLLNKVCSHCGEEQMFLHGIGTQKLEEICRREFPDANIVRMDQDQTAGKNAHAKLLKEFRDHPRSILIGTQMIAKGHDFPRLTVAAVVAADQLLGRNDIRAAEKAFQLVAQTAGRAGRKDLPGDVYIQAFDIDHYALITAAQHDYYAFVPQELSFRKTLNYPPYSVRGLIVISAEKDSWAKKEAWEIYSSLERLKTEGTIALQFLEPSPAGLYRIQGRWRWQIILSGDKVSGTKELSLLGQRLSLRKLPKGVRISFTLDPA